MQKDLVCGMSVDPNTAEDSTTYQGKTYYFCSTECKEKFDKRPTQFTKQQQQPSV
jgi:Cu+-exporting ATPase